MDWLDCILEFINFIVQEYGYIDVLVNNVGINQKKLFLEVINEDFDCIVKIN